MDEFSIRGHRLVPEHRKMKAQEVDELLKKYRTQREKLPKIQTTDVGIAGLEAESGDVIEITRKSPTAGMTKYYRVVI